ncbi:hypothetical protein N7466_003514 [Penicillium verhagenii]|uniref:uncharacterized protein n=1 Tax=Penicillium verhagenii TaxID=1562060 RepID=UPI0025456A5E|nr:uncharacterized protein N7466_003514 [Penicillium verhagenii]KAJ5937064.1 hypothetical protein N7466_003514 [Penicillium verhagenii]
MAIPIASPTASPLRLLPGVQNLQQNSPYTDVYTNAAISPLRTRSNIRHLRDETSHSHPEPQRWQNPGGWGARHINDHAPFTLWSEEERKFRSPTKDEFAWIHNMSGASGMFIGGCLLCITTTCPPKPIPLTIGTMPAIFRRPEEPFNHPTLLPESGYSNPRISDPCPSLRWPPMTDPTTTQMMMVLEAMSEVANVVAATFFPSWTVFELETSDNRSYGLSSLPGVVAGHTALYHHKATPFLPPLRSPTRPRLVVPNPDQAIEDLTNYLQNSPNLTPGCRVESGLNQSGRSTTSANASATASATAATTCGVKICNSMGEEALTVAHHGFLHSTDVYHPSTHGGDFIGEVTDSRPELNVGLVKFTPAASARFTNSCYFQAAPPTCILEGSKVSAGSWSEVDGMSSGMISLMKEARRIMRPPRPTGHPAVLFTQWNTGILYRVFGNISNRISDGICGAPIVDVNSSGVAGFFHRSDEGTYCYSAELDDLVAEEWNIVQ